MSGHSGRCFRDRRKTARRHRLQRERFELWRKKNGRDDIGNPIKMYSSLIGRWMVPRSINDVGELFKKMLAENFG